MDGKEVGRVPVDLNGRNFEPVSIELDDKFDNFTDSSRLRLYLDAQTDSGYSMKTDLLHVSAETDFKAQAAISSFEILDPNGKTVVNHKN